MKDDNSPLNEKHKAILQSEHQAKTALDISSLPERNEQDDVDSSAIDQQWLTLTQDWQAQSVKKTDIDALLKQTKRRTLWAKSCFVLNVIATISLIVAFIFGALTGELGRPFNSYVGLGALMSLVFVYYEMKIRAQAWAQISASPDKAIANALAGYQSSLKYMVLTKWSCLPFGLLGNWLVYTVGQQSDKSTLKGYIFINLIIFAMLVGTEILHRKRKKEYQELLAKTSN